MGLEAATGGGLTGAELDALLPAATGTPRTSRIVAGYLARVDSPGARLGRALLGDRDWTAPDEIVFPTVVLATLSAEVARDAAASKKTSSSRTGRPDRGAPGRFPWTGQRRSGTARGGHLQRGHLVHR